MGTTTWTPTDEEVERIVAEFRPVIDECVTRANRLLAAATPEANLDPRG